MLQNRTTLIKSTIARQAQHVNQQIKDNNPKVIENNGEQTVITNVPAEGLYIQTPGTYVFGNDINWTPPNPNLFAAIVITCDNVTLDLQNYHLIGEGNFVSTSLGIIVINGFNSFNNITIKNGTVKNIGLCGVWAVNASSLNISNITVEGLSYSGFDFIPSGICLYNCNTFNMDNCLVQNNSVTAMLGAGILLLECAQGGSVNSCTVEGLTNNDGVAGGFVYMGCAGVNAQDCLASALYTFYGGNAQSKIGHTCIGFMPTESNNLRFEGCTASGITGCCDDCHGMSLFSVDTVYVFNFTATNILDGDCPQKTGAKATGLEVYGNNVNVVDSQVGQITAIVPQDLQSTGFSACGTNITFNSCTASNVQVLNANKQPDISLGYGTGFGWAPDPRPKFVNPAVNVTYENCEAIQCQLGFDTWNHQNSNWIGPMAMECGLTHLIQPKGAERIYSMNFCSELPDALPSSPAVQFPIYNSAENNNYPA